MASRRMFSRRIAESARFLKMGAGAQLLYFHLCLRADDDGAVEAYSVRRGIGANEDDLQNLIGRGFLSVIDQDNEVVLINDWNEHNNIRADRVQPSVYREEIREMFPDFALKEPSKRSDLAKRKTRTDSGRSTDGPVDGPVDGPWTGNGPLRIGKDRLVKYSEDRLSDSMAREVVDYLNERCGRRFKKTKTSMKEIRARLNEGYTADDLKRIIDFKASQWMRDAKMSAYLRPSTLFNATNCMNYQQEVESSAMGVNGTGDFGRSEAGSWL